MQPPIEQTPQSALAPEQQATPEQQTKEPEARPALTKQEAEMASHIVNLASKLYKGMVPSLKKAPDPVKAAGELVANVFHQVLNRFNKEGQAIPMNVSQAASYEMLDDVLEIAEKGGSIQPNNEAERQHMYKKALSELGKTYTHSEAISQKQRQDAGNVEQEFIKRKGEVSQGQAPGQQPQGPPPQVQPQQRGQPPQQVPPQGQPPPGYMEGM